MNGTRAPRRYDTSAAAEWALKMGTPVPTGDHKSSTMDEGEDDEDDDSVTKRGMDEPSKFEQWLSNTPTKPTSSAKDAMTSNHHQHEPTKTEEDTKEWVARMEKYIRDDTPPPPKKTTTDAAAGGGSVPSLTQKTTLLQDFMDREEAKLRSSDPAMSSKNASDSSTPNNNNNASMPGLELAPSITEVKAGLHEQYLAKQSKSVAEMEKFLEETEQGDVTGAAANVDADEMVPETDAIFRGFRDWVQSVVSLSPISSFEGTVPLRAQLLSNDLASLDNLAEGNELPVDRLSISVDKTRRSIDVARAPLEVTHGNTRIIIYRRVNDPVALNKNDFYALNKSVMDPARVTLGFSDPVKGTRVKVILRPKENAKTGLLKESVWIGEGKKGRHYILRFSSSGALQDVLLVYPSANIAEAYHTQELTAAEKNLGDKLVAHGINGSRINTEHIPHVLPGTDAYVASLAMASALTQATPKTEATKARDLIKDNKTGKKIDAETTKALQQYVSTMQTMSTEAQRLFSVTAQVVAADRGKMLADYMTAKQQQQQATTTAPKKPMGLTAALNDAWVMLHLQTTRGLPQDAERRSTQYFTELAKGNTPAIDDFFG